MMNNYDFRNSVLRTARKEFRVLNNHDMALGNASSGLAGEAGEVLENIKKFLYHDIPLDMVKVKKELGDARYYLTWLEILLGFTAEETQEGNAQKLRERYPEGFTSGGGIREPRTGAGSLD